MSKPMRMSKRALHAPAALDKAKSQIDHNISCGSLFTRSHASASNNGNPMIQRCSHGVVRSQPLSVKYRCLPKSKICNDVFSSRNQVQRGDWGEHTECVREREREGSPDPDRHREAASNCENSARTRARTPARACMCLRVRVHGPARAHARACVRIPRCVDGCHRAHLCISATI